MSIILTILVIFGIAVFVAFVFLGCIYFIGKRDTDDLSAAIGESFDSFFWLQSCLKAREDYPKTSKLMNTILDTLIDIESIIQGGNDGSAE